ncbi:iron complex transport system ATP-binding protein [Desulfonispora thiosulfatigenes DSM 11270]|uniref:Iron complex transport system ATP-binding protein n=1 Tax=Desulfonispora thiosulfatigenes DSM 11270 TaxID=656914 RepID=A0A1W1UF25_DESTI|nr:ABC transporter ATP-binding protein [Desulfonispora thiosulfatigenes]SMB79697.1 iron complex transport system ATP-binding protein [Desulfonispora thiosulfatigenes DSM 11270]
MILSVKSLSFRYPSRSVIKDINFSISKGDFLAVLGINGAGKSTLLKCLNRILNPNAGIVYINDDEASKLSRRELAKKIGYVAQRNENIRSTVFDAVLLGRKPYIKWEVSKNDLEITQEALKVLDLEEYALRYLNELSGGEQQKVVIARALAQKPEILLLDEPTSSLDLKNQLEVARVINKVAKEQQMAAIVTMHDLNLAIRFADKFILLKNGQIFAAGGSEVITPENIESVYSVPVKIDKVGDIPVVIPK